MSLFSLSTSSRRMLRLLMMSSMLSPARTG